MVRLTSSNSAVDVSLDNVLHVTLPNAQANQILSSAMAADIIWGLGSGFVLDEIKIFDRVFTAEEQCVLVIEGTWDTNPNSCDPTPTESSE